jgi:dTDP-4-amino-4,6-dideoxygalactose transaminase
MKTLYQGKRVGALGSIGYFSYYPTKNLGAIGDGGALVTDDALLEEKFRPLREYGWKERYVSSAEEWNSRLGAIQAAILRVKLNALDADNDRRRRHAEKYQDMLQALPLQLPKLREDVSHVYHLFVVQTDNRDALKTYLREHGIQTAIQYPVPIHQQDYYTGRSVGHVSLPVTEEAAVRVLSLPMYPEFSEPEQEKVIESLKRFGSFR